MAYAEDLVKLRKRMLDAITAGVVEDNVKDFYEATLIQIMNEAEKQRQTCLARAEDMRRQAAVADGQAHAFTQVSSIVYSVLNGYIMVAERQQREEAERAAENAEKEADKAAALEAEALLSGSEESKPRKKK
jgi:hypothetical protein